MKTVMITEPLKIGELLDYVHDRTFELSKLRFDEKKATVEIPLTVASNEIRDLRKVGFIQLWKIPIYEAELRIRNATSFRVKDGAHIDEGMINTITYTDGCVSILCSVPVEIEIPVSSFAIELAISDIQRGENKGFALGFS